jgi:hypothetical protein
VAIKLYGFATVLGVVIYRAGYGTSSQDRWREMLDRAVQ